MSWINLRTGRRAAAVAAGVATALVFGGSAYAYFNAGGSGSGSATVGVGQTIKSVAVTPSTGLLYPSATFKGDLRLTLTSPVKATVTAVAQDLSRAVTVTGGLGPCSGTNITLQTAVVNILLTANTPFTTTIPAVVSMSSSAPNGCQGASFTIPVVLTGSETP